MAKNKTKFDLAVYDLVGKTLRLNYSIVEASKIFNSGPYKYKNLLVDQHTANHTVIIDICMR